MEHAFPHQNLVSVADLELDHILSLYSTAAALKAERDRYNDLLAGKRLAMVFEKESLRTRFTFDPACAHLFTADGLALAHLTRHPLADIDRKENRASSASDGR